MKKIEAIIRHFKLEDVKKALTEAAARRDDMPPNCSKINAGLNGTANKTSW